MIRGAVLALLLCARAARGDVVAVPDTKVTLELPAAWQRVEVAGVVLGAKGPATEVLAITRAQVPNPDAWRTKKREAYADQIERGIAAKIAGYKRTARKLGEIHTIPVLDLEARRAGGATVVIRILLYRTYALALAIEVPRRGSPKPARAIAASFTPPSPT